MKINYKIKHIEEGFTLVELLIGMVAGILLLGSLYIIFKAQLKSYNLQSQYIGMQNNIRIALTSMAKEIRMAGYDPKGTAFSSASPIQIAKEYEFSFAYDKNQDGVIEPNEVITYQLKSTDDTDNNGIADNGATMLIRKVGTNSQPLADDVEAIGFAYAFTENTDNNQLAYNSTGINKNIYWCIPYNGYWYNLDINDDGLINKLDDINNDNIIDIANTNKPVVYNNIRAIKIWLLIRSEHPDESFIDNNSYIVGKYIITPKNNDTDKHYRHWLLTITVKLRNMGLNQ